MTDPIMKIDHISEDGIRRLVDEFYARVRADTELAPIFNRAIPGDWDYTLRRCATFGGR
jgi:hemoglobin